MSDLKTIPGIGPGLEAKLIDLGIPDVVTLARQEDAATLAGLLGQRPINADVVGKWIAAARGGTLPPPVPNDEPATLPQEIPAPTPAPVSILHQLNRQGLNEDRARWQHCEDTLAMCIPHIKERHGEAIADRATETLRAILSGKPMAGYKPKPLRAAS